MSRQIIVVDQRQDWGQDLPELDVVTAREYLQGGGFRGTARARVTNLCRSYGYLSTGYYVSLLAEARGHRVLPSVRTLTELRNRSVYALEVDELDALVQRSLRHASVTEFGVILHFGACEYPELEELGRQIFEAFPCPLLRVEFRKAAERWRLTRVRPWRLQELAEEDRLAFAGAVQLHLARRWRNRRTRRGSFYDLAILVDPDEALPPSDSRALRSMIRAARELDLDAELITRRDYARVPEFDALFIRTTTGIEHYTYRFARRAEAEGMIVIDDPTSILRCTNKIYLAEILRARRVPTPRTVILDRRGIPALEDSISYPIVLKIPDGSFSRGVFLVHGRDELESTAENLFRDSDLILAQEFVYTPFDWRIGVLNGVPIFACRYYMADRHWQILQHRGTGGVRWGRWDTVSVEEVPAPVLQAAVRATRPIGTGLYGVDVKEAESGPLVIEVNDNPNLESGVEDAIAGAELYRSIFSEFVRRLEELKRR